MVAVRVFVAAVEERPVRGGDLGADLARERDAGGGDPAPLLLHLLALVVVERREKIGEVAIARILPAELHAVPDDHARRRACLGLGRGRKQDVQRRERWIAAAWRRLQSRERGPQQRGARRFVGGEEPLARRRGERDRRHQLRVVAAPVPAVRIGPRPVEHVLAVRMRLGVERQRPDERVGAPGGEVARRPARGRRGAAGLVQRAQERVGGERLPAGQGVPVGGGDRRDADVVANGQRVGGRSCRKGGSGRHP